MLKVIGFCKCCGKFIYKGQEIRDKELGYFCSEKCLEFYKAIEKKNIDEDFHDDIDLFEPENDDYPNDYYEGW